MCDGNLFYRLGAGWRQWSTGRVQGWLLVVLSVALVACARLGVGSGDRVSAGDGGGEAAMRFVGIADLEQALTDEDPALLHYLDAMEKAVPRGDLGYLRGVVDQDALMGRIMEGMPETRAVRPFRRGFESGTRKAWESAGVLDGYAGAHYRFLRIREINGMAGALFRASEGDDQIDYHLHLLTRDSAGRFRVGDLYLVGLSECASTSLRRGFIHLVNHSLGGEVLGTAEDEMASRAFVDHLDEIGEMSRAIAERRFAEALDRYQALPERVRDLREIKVMRIEAAARLSPLSLYDSLEEWKSDFGDANGLPLKFIDYHAARGEYDEAYDLAKRVEGLIGHDPYLRVRIGELRYAIYHEVPALRFVRNGARNGRGKPELLPTEGRR